MENVTRHAYLDRYPVDPNSTRVVVGTIHPHDEENFFLPFFYGNKMSLWKMLNLATNGELNDPNFEPRGNNRVFRERDGFEHRITLDSILRFLRAKRISMSDAVRECRRPGSVWADAELIPTRLNVELVDQIRDSQIAEVLFMSGFGKTNAFKLFYVDILRQKITPEIRARREVVCPPEIFGRPVKFSILYSPSGAANVAIAQSPEYRAVKERYALSTTPVRDFKIDYYRRKFCLDVK